MSKHVTICLAFTRPSKEGLNTCQLSVFQKQKLWRVRKNWFFFNWGHSVYKLSKPLDPTHTEQSELGPAFVSHGWSLRTWLELHGETGDILSQSCNFKQPGMSQDLCILCSLWVSMTQGWQTGKMVYNWVCVMMHKMSGTTNTQKLRDPTPASPPDDSDLLANSENSTPFEVKLWCPAKTDPSRSFNPSPYPRPFESCLKLMMHCKVHAAVQPGIKKTVDTVAFENWAIILMAGENQHKQNAAWEYNSMQLGGQKNCFAHRSVMLGEIDWRIVHQWNGAQNTLEMEGVS